MVRPFVLTRCSLFWFLVILVGILAKPVMATEEADRLWNFADYLYQKEDFYRALGEYQRFLFLFPADSRTPQAELRIGRCYWLGGKPEKAYTYLLSLFNRRAGESVGRQALLGIVAIREEQELYPEAVYWAKRYIERYPDDPQIDKTHLHLAWLQINSGEYAHALATLSRISPDSQLYSQATSLSQALQQRSDRGQKSPGLAGTLAAILPGAGHLYAGRPGQAVTSLLLNGLFIGAAVAAFNSDSPVLGGILVFFEMGWYQGGIRSAAKAARDANEEKERQYRQELKSRYQFSLGVSPGADRLAVSVNIIF